MENLWGMIVEFFAAIFDVTLYFPVAEIPLNLFVVLGLGAAVGFASGLFGVGGGFLMTPLLIFIGVPPPVAVATQANQLVASSLSGFLAQWKKQLVDIKMGTILLLGGLVGAVSGVGIFTILQNLGQIDLAIALCYVFFLGSIATFMLLESLRTLNRQRKGIVMPVKAGGHGRLTRALPFKMRFPRSKLYISALVPALIGLIVGLLVSIMGVGGGFLMVPAMIYLLGMPAQMVSGTSLFQVMFITGLVTIMQAAQNQTVDVLLAMILLFGSVIGAQFGARSSGLLKPAVARMLLAIITLVVCLKMLHSLIIPPENPYSMERIHAT